MFIQTEQTPNPATLKFLPGETVLDGQSCDFPSFESAKGVSPLAEKLLNIDGVRGVFFGHDFISVTKDEDQEWYVLKPSILGTLMEHFTAAQPILYQQAAAPTHDTDTKDDAVVTQIKELLDTRVRPAVAQDGGDIVFHGFEKGIVYLAMQGACAGCPSSTATLKMGIENMLRHYVPEVIEVRPVA